MIESTIRDFKAEVTDSFDQMKKLMDADVLKEYSDQIKEVENKLERTKPSLMFYGIYNAGKSSLLNAIMGEKVASVNDIPETHKVSYYSWKSYTLVDTPGLNGPEEDEKITVSEVNKHDIIMFVIDDSDNFDSDVITRKIIEILESKKPCIIVINKKNDSDMDKILHIKAKMEENISKLSNVKHNFSFIALNAESALKAKQDDKPKLLSDSNIQRLEYEITKALESADGIQMLSVPIDLMINLSTQVIGTYKNRIEEKEIENLTKLNDRLSSVRTKICQDFNSTLKAKLAGYSKIIYNQAVNQGEVTLDQKQCENEIKKIIAQYSEEFAAESKVKLGNFSNEWKVNLEIGDIEVPDDKTLPKGTVNKDEIDQVLDELEKIPIPIYIPDVIPVPIPMSVIVGVVKGLKKFIFGSGSDAAPDISALNYQQEELARKREQAIIDLNGHIAMQMDALYNTVSRLFSQELDSAYSKCSDNIADVIKTKKSNDELITKKIRDMSQLADYLKNMKEQFHSMRGNS
jgi:predicted GTPase